MASLVPGYTYDIFISYRQKDNKHDGWVTEFVDNLKGELESTFKEDVSVYFDINPHDGLLETHDVEASLKDKLKCLVFIPIISQTYCDSKSFAWQNEFCAFNKLAKEDQFGRDIKLAGGNVSSRILPVKIHDLDSEDKALLENELGGVLRGIEFIYKSAGVNRPLRANEDHPQDNLNKTYYRDQINKVANAVKEVITALKKHEHQDRKISKDLIKTKPDLSKGLKPLIITGILLVMIVLVSFFIFPKLLKSSVPVEKTIAVLPFRNDSNDPENQHIIDGTMEAILDNLCKIADLKVISRTSMEQYRNTTKSIPKISKELKANYILEGSGQKIGDDIRITVQLIDGINDKHIWSRPYDKKIRDIFQIQSEVAQAIASEIKAIITPEEKKLIEKIPTASLKAYDKYLIANEYLKDYIKTHDTVLYQKAVTSYKAALEIDSAFARAYTGLVSAYYTRYSGENYYNHKIFLDSCLALVNKALTFDDQLDEAYYFKGLYYRGNGKFEEALASFNKALKVNQNFYQVYFEKTKLLRNSSNDHVEILDMTHKALDLTGEEGRTTLLQTLIWTYGDLGFPDKAKKYGQEKLDLDRDSAFYYKLMAWLKFCSANFEESVNLVKKAEKRDPSGLMDQFYFNMPSVNYEEAFLHAKKLIESYTKKKEADYRNSFRIGYSFYNVGKYKEAEDFFTRQIEYSEASIKQNTQDALSKQPQLSLAFLYAFKGDRNKAYKYLDELNTLSFYPKQRLTLIKNDPMGASINKEERFQKIISEMEAKYQAEHDRVKKWLEENNML